MTTNYPITTPQGERLLYVTSNNGGQLWTDSGANFGYQQLASLADVPGVGNVADLKSLGKYAVMQIKGALYSVDIAPALDRPATGALINSSASVVQGWVRDNNMPQTGLARIAIDGVTVATVDALAASPTGYGHGFAWYVPPLPAGNHTIDVYAVDGWTQAGTKIGSQTVAGTGALFDERWYLAKNPDVAAAVKAGTLPSAYTHFVAAGQFEGRDPSPYFSTAFYLARYPDVAAAVAQHMLASAWIHFERAGQFEQRDPSPFFSTAYYLQQNPDVAAAVTANGMSPFVHFFFAGQLEGRNTTPWFDQRSYLAMNPDVAPMVSSGAFESALMHYLLAGGRERRPFTAPNPFNEGAYLAANPDVASAVTQGRLSSGLEHYLLTGMREGRSLGI